MPGAERVAVVEGLHLGPTPQARGELGGWGLLAEQPVVVCGAGNDRAGGLDLGGDAQLHLYLPLAVTVAVAAAGA